MISATVRYRCSRTARIAVALLLCGALAGCGSGLSDAGTAETDAPEVTTLQMTPAFSEAEVSPTPAPSSLLRQPGQLPVVHRPATLRISMYGTDRMASLSARDNPLTAWLEDRTGVRLEFLVYPAADADPQGILQYGDLGDLCLLPSDPLDRATEWSLVEQERLLSLDGLLARQGYHLRELLHSRSHFRTVASGPDEILYTFPLGEPESLQPERFGPMLWIQRDFLARYGGPMPSDTDRLAAYLQWAVYEDANGNGTQDEIGWTGAEPKAVPGAAPTDFIMDAFCYQSSGGYYQRDGMVHAAFVEDGYREGLKYLAMLMESGLMDPVYATYTQSDLAARISRQNGAVAALVASDDLRFLSPDIRLRYAAVPPLTGPDGFRFARHDDYAGITPGAAFIPADSGNPELAFAWMDALYDQETALWCRYGARDTDWEVAPEGATAVDGGPALFRLLRDPDLARAESGWDHMSPAMWDRAGPLAALTDPADAEAVWAGVLLDAARTAEEAVEPCSLPPLFFEDPADRSRADAMRDTIDSLYRGIVKEFIYGVRDVRNDAAWGGYVSELFNAGLPEYLALLGDGISGRWAQTLPEGYTPYPQRDGA